jgi:hypothetical protein
MYPPRRAGSAQCPGWRDAVNLPRALQDDTLTAGWEAFLLGLVRQPEFIGAERINYRQAYRTGASFIWERVYVHGYGVIADRADEIRAVQVLMQCFAACTASGRPWEDLHRDALLAGGLAPVMLLRACGTALRALQAEIEAFAVSDPAVNMPEIRPIDKRDYDIPLAGDPRMMEELKWFATAGDAVLGVVIRNRADGDYGWVALTRAGSGEVALLTEAPMPVGAYRAVESSAWQISQRAATEELHSAMRRHARELQQ